MFKRFVTVHVLVALMLPLLLPLVPAEAEERASGPVRPTQKAAREVIDWASVDWDSDVVLPSDLADFEADRRALVESGRTEEAAVLRPKNRKMYDEIVLGAMGAPEEVKGLVRRMREGASFLQNDDKGKAVRKAEVEYLQQELRGLFPEVKKVDTQASLSEQFFDISKAKRLRPKKVNVVELKNGKPKAETKHRELEKQSPRALKQSTVRQLRAKKVGSVKRGAQASVSETSWFASLFNTVFGVDAAGASTPIIAYSSGIENKPLDHALYTLSVEQNENGSFGEVNPYATTFEVVGLLNDINRTNNDQYTAALDYLLQTEPQNNREKAMKARVLFEANQAGAATQLLDEVAGAQNANGGFGLESGYASDPETSLDVALSMWVMNYSIQDKMPKALFYVLNQIAPNGEMFYTEESESSYYLMNRTAQKLAPFAGLSVGNGQNNIVVQSKIDAILGYLSSQYDEEDERIFGADAGDLIMTLETWRLYGTRLDGHKVLTRKVGEAQNVDGSFGNSLLMTLHAIYALAEPDMVVVSAAEQGQLQNYAPAWVEFTVKNQGYAATATGTLHLFVDGVETDMKFDFLGNQITITPGETVTIALEYLSTEAWSGSTELRWFWEGDADLNYDDNWFVKTVTVASDPGGRPALPGYFTAFKFMFNSRPAVLTTIPAVKPDPLRDQYVLSFRQQGEQDWTYFAYDPAKPMIGHFPEDSMMEFRMGVSKHDQVTIVSYQDPVVVKMNSDTTKYRGKIEGRVTLDHGPLVGLKPFIQDSELTVPDENGFFSSVSSPNGRVSGLFDRAMYVPLHSLFEVPIGGTVQGRIFTRLKEDVEAPVIDLFEIRFKNNFKVTNQKEVTLFAVGRDNVAMKTADFFLWNPIDSTWSYLGTKQMDLSSQASLAWYVPSDLLGSGFKVKAILTDYRGNQSTPKEWGPFTIIDGTTPTFAITAPAAGEQVEIGKPYTVRWSTSSKNPVNQVRIDIRHPNASVETIKSNVPNTGSYEWFIRTSTDYVGDNVTLEISGTDSVNFETGVSKSAVFSIVDKTPAPALPWGDPKMVLNDLENKSSTMTKDSVQLTYDKTGVAHLVYRTNDDTVVSPRVITQTIWHRTYSGGAWSAAEKVHEETVATDNNLAGYTPFYDVQLALDSNNKPHIVWRRGVSGGCDTYNQNEIYYSYFNGTQWGQPVNVSDNGTESLLPEFAADENGTVHIAWVDGKSWDASCVSTGERTMRYRTVTNGALSSEEAVGQGKSPNYPQLTVSSGVVHAVFSSGTSLVHMKRQAGNWQEVEVMSTDVTVFDALALATDPSSALHLATKEFAKAPNTDRYHHRISYRSFQGGAWAASEIVTTTDPAWYDSFAGVQMQVTAVGQPHLTFVKQLYNESRREPTWTFKQNNGTWYASQRIARESQSVAGSALPLALHPSGAKLMVAWTGTAARMQEVYVNEADLSQDFTLPALVSGLKAEVEGVAIKLSWDPYQDPSGEFKQFALYRDTQPRTDTVGLTPISTVQGVTTTTYIDSTVAPGIDYYYYVTAVEVSGKESVAGSFIGPVKVASPDQNVKVYEDAENGDTVGWSLVPNLPGSTVTNVDSGDPAHKRVIDLKQLDASKSFSFNQTPGQPWDYQNFKTLSWDAKFGSDVQYFLFVNTTNGVRYLAYGTKLTPGKVGSSIRFKLSPEHKDGSWRTITRDLQKDLEALEPGNTITSLSYFNVQGTGQIDNFKLSRGAVFGNIIGTVTDSDNKPIEGVMISLPGSQTVVMSDASGSFAASSLPVGTYTVQFAKFGYTFADQVVTIPADGATQTISAQSAVNNEIVYEDAENGDTAGWSFVQNVAGSSITNVDSGDAAHHRVIELKQLDASKSFSFNPVAGQPWDYQNFKTLSWDAKFGGDVQYFVFVNTTGGVRYMAYGTKLTTGKVGNSIRFKLSPEHKDGSWRTITRDLQKDLEALEPGNTITSLSYFNVQGTGQIDNFKLSRGVTFGNITGIVTDSNSQPMPGVVVTTAGAQVAIETNASGTFAIPSLPVGTYTLSFTKFGYTVPSKTVTIPADGTNQVVTVVVPPSTEIVYEDAENGDTAGWSLAQNVAGSSVANVDSGDAVRGRVIELAQLDASKSFNFHQTSGQPWDYQNFKTLSWDAKFGGDVQYFVFVNTTGGIRYMAYGTKLTTGKVGSSVRFNLGPEYKDGSWRTIVRDLQQDLESVEPGNTITSLSYFNVQGTGQIDNFKLMKNP